ncbi:hypothetical protein MJO29_014102 [Puccinia striiformis f. sp. tritici]|nr:hypothetical protein Pst134EB_027266 [Puccinia striiformis f. sp. tritici]KAI7939366.1 hypothetical protein MJO29_014102 [Puccinia striiformis f. sp. tritici]KAI9616442.1 hypothetical protein H4Q26_010835 [Puccinia striiformis f. sp. tritici PST-130]
MNSSYQNSTTSTQQQQQQHSFLSRADLKDSLNTLNNLLKTAKTYRTTLTNLANATASFAKSLEDCARLKGTQAIHQDQLEYDHNSDSHSSHHHQQPIESTNPAEKLLAASGLHFITANLEQVLSDTFQNSFEIPLSNLYESYRQQLAHQQSQYEHLLSIKTKSIRDTEFKNMNPSNSSGSRRDLDSFRKGLMDLQDQVQQVESLKHSYYLQVANGEREVWNKVAENISLIVKSEVEVYDRIASKPISDPTLEAMVSSIPDPFDTYKPIQQRANESSRNQQTEIYSILSPLNSLIIGSPTKTRRSTELNDSLASLASRVSDHHRSRLSFNETSEQSSSPLSSPSLDDHHVSNMLDEASEWAHSVVHRSADPFTSSSSSSTDDRAGLPPKNDDQESKSLSTKHSNQTTTTLKRTTVDSYKSSDDIDDHTLVVPSVSSAPSSSINHLPHLPPPMNRASTTATGMSILQPRIDEVDSLLGEPPPNGLDLSDSDI